MFDCSFIVGDVVIVGLYCVGDEWMIVMLEICVVWCMGFFGDMV